MKIFQLHNLNSWKTFAPKLHICEQEKMSPWDFSAGDDPAGRLKADGYLHEPYLDRELDFDLLADSIRQLSEINIPPVFAFVYDEFWAPFFKLHSLFSVLLGGEYYLLPDFWAWNIDPSRGESGWNPHRDKGRFSLFDDGTPKSITAWIPLSTATPLNSCIYVVPAMFDPTYNTPEEASWKFELPSVRALPGKPGDCLIWNQAIIHWGSKTSPSAQESRVSVAFELQRADVPPFNMPLIRPLTTLSFDSRLQLIAKQVLQYRHMYNLGTEIERFALEIIASKRDRM